METKSGLEEVIKMTKDLLTELNKQNMIEKIVSRNISYSDAKNVADILFSENIDNNLILKGELDERINSILNKETSNVIEEEKINFDEPIIEEVIVDEPIIEEKIVEEPILNQEKYIEVEKPRVRGLYETDNDYKSYLEKFFEGFPKKSSEDKPKQEEKIVEEPILNQEEYIEVEKPRVRGLNESDNDYNEYLRGHFESFFDKGFEDKPKQEEKIVVEEPIVEFFKEDDILKTENNPKIDYDQLIKNAFEKDLEDAINKNRLDLFQKTTKNQENEQSKNINLLDVEDLDKLDDKEFINSLIEINGLDLNNDKISQEKDDLVEESIEKPIVENLFANYTMNGAALDQLEKTGVYYKNKLNSTNEFTPIGKQEKIVPNAKQLISDLKIKTGKQLTDIKKNSEELVDVLRSRVKELNAEKNEKITTAGSLVVEDFVDFKNKVKENTDDFKSRIIESKVAKQEDKLVKQEEKLAKQEEKIVKKEEEKLVKKEDLAKKIENGEVVDAFDMIRQDLNKTAVVIGVKKVGNILKQKWELSKSKKFVKGLIVKTNYNEDMLSHEDEYTPNEEKSNVR